MSRVSPGLLLIGFFAILTALSIVYGVRKSLQRPVVAAPAAPKLKTVILASADLEEGRAITASDFFSMTLTPEQFSKRTWPPLMMVDGKQIVKRILKRPLKRGQPFDPDSFYPEGSGPNVAGRLAPGLLGVPVEIPIEGIPSHATPGQRVDLIFRSTPKKDDPIPELTKTLIMNAELLGIGENTTRGLLATLDSKQDTQRIILAVTSDQAMRIKAIEGHGTFSLVLRSSETDRSSLSDQKSLTLAEVLDLPPPVPEPTPIAEPMPVVTETYRRGRRQVNVFTPDGATKTTANSLTSPRPGGVKSPDKRLNSNPTPSWPPSPDLDRYDLPRPSQDSSNEVELPVEEPAEPDEPSESVPASRVRNVADPFLPPPKKRERVGRLQIEVDSVRPGWVLRRPRFVTGVRVDS